MLLSPFGSNPPTTVKLVLLVAVPPGVVTAIAPLRAPAGTVDVIWLALSTTNDALTPLKVTSVAPVKFVPAMITEVLLGPVVGLKLRMVGAGMTLRVMVPALDVLSASAAVKVKASLPL